MQAILSRIESYGYIKVSDIATQIIEKADIHVPDHGAVQKAVDSFDESACERNTGSNYYIHAVQNSLLELLISFTKSCTSWRNVGTQHYAKLFVCAPVCLLAFSVCIYVLLGVGRGEEGGGGGIVTTI